MELFVRESGPPGAPAIVFLHGGRRGGWCWEPVIERLPGYRCLAPDLPHYGGSVPQAPFEMSRAAEAVAELIRSRTDDQRAHVVGFSLGAQVGVRLLADEPGHVHRALLCGTIVNTLPGVRVTQLLAARLARSARFRTLVNRRLFEARDAAVPTDRIDDHRGDLRLISTPEFVDIVAASAGFTVPDGLRAAESPALFLTGARETPIARHWAAALARPMPHGIDGLATGMGHDWPIRHPDLFARTVDDWLSGTVLPPEIRLQSSRRRRISPQAG